MRPVWKGSISFGLVTIPVALFSATKREELKFRMLRKGDLSPINYKRVAKMDGKEVPWADIVKGYEYEKGKFVIITDEDFKRVDIEATETIDIVDFVQLDEIDPMFFHKPYFLEPQKGGGGAYALLRAVLAKTGKTGIAKVVIKTRQHLAALKATEKMLILELMHFADEIVGADKIKAPTTKLGKREEAMAISLVDQMTEKWDPARYTDDYRSTLMKVIEAKVEAGGKELPKEKTKSRAATNVIDLVSVLQKSLQEAGKAGGGSAGKGGARKKSPSKASKKTSHKRAA